MTDRCEQVPPIFFNVSPIKIERKRHDRGRNCTDNPDPDLREIIKVLIRTEKWHGQKCLSPGQQ